MSFSLSRRLPPGVEGWEREEEISPVADEEEGESIGDLVGEVRLGGVLALIVVGVAGTNASCGADLAKGN